MVNIDHFLKSLKLTWLRWTIRESLSWQFAFHQIIKKRPFMWAFGSNYLQTHIKCIDNPFWRDIFAAHICLEDKSIIECFNDILKEPLWFHSHFNHGYMCIHNSAKQDIFFIKYTLSEKGTFFSDLKQRLKIKGTYLDRIWLQKSLPKTWRELINNKSIENICLLRAPPFLNWVDLLLKDPAGSKTIYNVLTRCKHYEPICIRRWDRLLPNGNRHWSNIFEWSFKCTSNVRLNVF